MLIQSLHLIKDRKFNNDGQNLNLWVLIVFKVITLSLCFEHFQDYSTRNTAPRLFLELMLDSYFYFYEFCE